MLDVSIIIIVFNVREEVLRCLRSIDAYAPPVTVETIVVDQGSTDGTGDAVTGAFPDVTVIRRERNEGLAGRNHGLRAAAGCYRMFLDSDARLTEGALPRLVRFMDDHAEAGLVGPRLVYPNGELQLSTRRYPPRLVPLLRRPPLQRFFGDSPLVRRHLMVDEPHDATREVEYVLGACQLFSAGAQGAAGEIHPRMFFGPDDAEWCFRIRMAGLKVFYCPEATVVHDYRRASAHRPLSRMAFRHAAGFYGFQWRWRRHRRRLVQEGREMDRRASEQRGAAGGVRSRPAL